MIINTPISFAMLDSKGAAKPYIPGSHLMLLEKKLLEVYSGKLKRLIVNMPPRHGKTELTSKWFPFWWLLNRPDDEIILSSYASTLAEKCAIQAKAHFKEYGYIKDLKVEIDRNDEWSIKNHKGSITAVGVGGSITGKGANVLIVDDPIKNHEQALSVTYRDKIWDWFVTTALTRLEEDGAVIIVMTRWHHDDLVGRLIKEMDADGEQYEVVNLPAIAFDNDIIGRKKGEALFPNKFSIEKLLQRKKTMGSFFFSAMYQQEPIDNEHQIFQRNWWRYYDDNINFDFKIQVWDTAYEKGKENDYSVCATWGWYDKNFYLIDIFRDKLLFPELYDATINQHEKHKPNSIFIEDAGSGKSLIHSLQKQTKINIKAVGTMDKIVRAHIATPFIESGRVLLPSGKSFLDDFMSEHNQFPSAKHDDIVDTTTIAIQLLSQYVKSERVSIERKSRSRIEKYSNY